MADGIIRHFINDTEVQGVFGWRDFTEEFERNVKERLISVKYGATLTFVEDAYKILNDLYLSDGACSSVRYEARQECDGIMRVCVKGEVFIADSEFNESRCSVEVSIVDDGIGARILNNNSIPVSPTAESTKNDEALTPLTPVDLLVFKPSDGSYYASPRRAWDWYDCIRNAVLYISDNTVTARSDWYEALPDSERYAILDGNELRVADGSNPRFTYSFGRLFTELAIKYDLWIFAGRDTNGDPELRIEPQGTFFDTTGSLQQTDLDNLIRSIDDTLLYGKVDVGSDTYIKALQTGSFSLPFLVLRGFTKEEFGFKGVCNTEETLDLVNEWAIDTNVIEDSVVNNNDEYDDKTFLIQYDQTTGEATQVDYLNPTNMPGLYNEQLQNFNVLDRYDMPSDVGVFYSPIDASFRAENTVSNTVYTETSPAPTTNAAQLQYDNDYTAPNFDTTNTWGNGTAPGTPVPQVDSRYTAPVQGYYVLDTVVDWRIVENRPFVLAGLRSYKAARLTVIMHHFNSSNVEIGGLIANNSGDLYYPGTYSVQVSAGLALDVGDYVTVEYQFDTTDFDYIPGNPIITNGGTPGVKFNIVNGTYIRTFFVAGGGFLAGGDVARMLKYEYERTTDLATWNALTSNPQDQVLIGGGPTATIPVHVLSATRNIATGATSFAMIKRP